MPNKKIFALFIFFHSLVLCNASYGSQIICDTDVSDSANQLVINANDDPYAFTKIDLPGEFRLAGQYFPSLNKVKLFVYNNFKNRYVLLSAQEFEVSSKTCSSSFGKNLFYSEPFERELFFQCRHLCKE
jgi:hypothetical protein